jgi:uncharacterized membrane protein YfcA
LVLSAAIGVSLGLIGGGGSILTVPIPVYFLGVEAYDAVGMSPAVGGAGLGTVLSHRLAANRLQKMFAVLVLAVSIFLFAKNYAILF